MVDMVCVDAFVPGDAPYPPTCDGDEGATLRVDDAVLSINDERIGEGVEPWRISGGDPPVANREGDSGCGDSKDGKGDSSPMSVDESDRGRPLFECDFILTFR